MRCTRSKAIFVVEVVDYMFFMYITDLCDATAAQG